MVATRAEKKLGGIRFSFALVGNRAFRYLFFYLRGKLINEQEYIKDINYGSAQEGGGSRDGALLR